MDDALSETRGPRLERATTPAATARIGLVVRTMPTWGWLVAAVLVSSVVGVELGFETHAPAIFNDELIYSEATRRLAESHLGSLGHLAASGYGVVYPLLLTPIYLAAHGSPQAYAIAKALNAVVFATATIPAFLLARRVLPNSWSLLVAALTVVGPQSIFTAYVMTENVFLPVFLWTCVASIRMIEKPTWQRQVIAVAALALASATRIQGLALIPGLAAAVLITALAPGRLGAMARLKPYRAVALLGGLAPLVLLAGELARGRTLASLFGAYSVLAQGYSPWASAKWSILNLADFDLLVGVALFAILPAALRLALRSSSATPASVILGSTLLGFGGSTFLLVGIFSSSAQGGHRVHDRYLFYLVPLALALGLWALRNGKLHTATIGFGVVVAGVLPMTLPFGRVRNWAWEDSLGLLPWQTTVFSVSRMAYFVIPTAIVIAAAVAFGRQRRLAIVIGALGLAVFFGFTSARAHARLNGEFHAGHGDWIDRAVGPTAKVNAIYFAAPCAIERREARWIAMWRAQFFNRSVALKYYVGSPLPGDLTSKRLTAGPDGVLRNRGAQAASKYVLVGSGARIRGTVVARERGQGLSLVRTDGDLALLGFSRASACRQARVQHGSAVGRDASVGA